MRYGETNNSSTLISEENTNSRPFAVLGSLIDDKTATVNQEKDARAVSEPQSLPEMPQLRRANDVGRQHIAEDRFLFDEFWREGEVSLMFGSESAGKSILATQIADSVARGRGIDGLKMTAKRQKVLYVDLNVGERQFAARYGGTILSANLHHFQPETEIGLTQHIERFVTEYGIGVVVVDSIDDIKRTLYGVRETLAFMRSVRNLSRQRGVSILVVAADHVTSGRDITPDQVAEYRLLCSAADSVFAIGRYTNDRDKRFVQQLRTRAAKIVWTVDEAPTFSIEREGRDMPRAVFDERFSPDIDEVLKAQLTEIARLRRDGVSYRDIGKRLGVSKTRVHELDRRWRTIASRWLGDKPEPRTVAEEAIVFDKYYTRRDHQEDLDRYGFDPSFSGDVIDVAPVSSETSAGTPMARLAPHEHPFAAALGHISILDLEQSVDTNGNEIYVEQWLGNTRKPQVWYRRLAKRDYRRYTRASFGINIERIPTGPYLSREFRIGCFGEHLRL